MNQEINAIGIKPRSSKTCNVSINVTPRRVLVTTVAVEKHQVLHIPTVSVALVIQNATRI